MEEKRKAHGDGMRSLKKVLEWSDEYIVWSKEIVQTIFGLSDISHLFSSDAEEAANEELDRGREG